MTADAQFTRHRGPITCVAGVPGQPLAITSGYDGAVGLFNLETGVVELLGYHRHLVNRVSVNAAGTRAASASSDYDICIWDLSEMCLERTLHGHSDDVEDFWFIDDDTGVSVSRDWRILIWDLRSGSIRRIIEGHTKDVLSVAYRDGKIITSGDDMTLRVWDADTGAALRVWGPFETEADTCAVDSVHGRVVLGCDDGIVRVFDLDTGATITQIPGHSSGIKKVACSPTTGDILSTAYDQQTLIWDAGDFTLKSRLEPRMTKWERSFNFSPDGRQVLAGTFDGTVLVWDVETSACLGELGERAEHEGNDCFNDVSVGERGEFATVTDGGYVRLGILAHDEARWLSKTPPASGRMLMNAVTLDPDRRQVISGAHDQRLHVFARGEDGLRGVAEVELSEGPVNCVRVCPLPAYEGHLFAACYSGAIVHLDGAARVVGTIRAHANAVKALRLHPSRALGVSCSADGVLMAWGLDGELLREYRGHTAIIDDVDIDPSGRFIASSGRDFILKVYEIDSGLLVHSIALHRRSPKGVCFLDVDTVIVTTYWGELIRVSLQSGALRVKQIARNGISAVTPSHEDNKLIAASYDGGVYLVDAHTLEVERTLRAMTQRVDGAPW